MDESSFLPNSLDAQVRILCETFSNHLRFLNDAGLFETHDQPNGSNVYNGSVILKNMKMILERQGLEARNSIRFLGDRLSEGRLEQQNELLDTLHRESELRDRLTVLRNQAQRAGIQILEEDIPHDASSPLIQPGPDFDEDLQSLIHVRDQLIQNIQRVDAIQELKQSS